MNKYYKILQKRRVMFMKVWDKVPDDKPNCFKKAKLIYREVFEVKFFPPSCYETYKTSSFCEGKSLDLELNAYKAVLITEEEYEKAKETFTSLTDTCSSMFDKLKSV